jgi:predicted ArsR family transcriptional regulator
VLHEPNRRRVYDTVRLAGAPLTRDEVASLLEIGRPLAAFHLDALAKAGLVDVDYARPPGRGGPGAGRPAKRYRATGHDITLNLPERRYDLAAQVLAAGIRDCEQSDDVRRSVFAAAREQGAQLARQHELTSTASESDDGRERVCAVLDKLGYEPVHCDGAVQLRNCPFHSVVNVAPELVCNLNVQLIEGLLDGLALGDLRADLAPDPPHCCVRIRDPSGSGG